MCAFCPFPGFDSTFEYLPKSIAASVPMIVGAQGALLLDTSSVHVRRHLAGYEVLNNGEMALLLAPPLDCNTSSEKINIVLSGYPALCNASFAVEMRNVINVDRYYL